MKLRPINDKILVKVALEEEVTSSGIILPASKQERKYEGTVVAVGENPDIKKAGIKPGVYVMYPKGLNTPTIIDDEEYDIVSVYDIQGVCEDA